ALCRLFPVTATGWAGRRDAGNVGGRAGAEGHRDGRRLEAEKILQQLCRGHVDFASPREEASARLLSSWQQSTRSRLSTSSGAFDRHHNINAQVLHFFCEPPTGPNCPAADAARLASSRRDLSAQVPCPTRLRELA